MFYKKRKEKEEELIKRIKKEILIARKQASFYHVNTIILHIDLKQEEKNTFLYLTKKLSNDFFIWKMEKDGQLEIIFRCENKN